VEPTFENQQQGKGSKPTPAYPLAFDIMSINDPAAAAYAAQAAAADAEVEIDLSKLNALSPEVISKQATVSCPISRYDRPS
jgi:hypothetical protein